MSKVIDHAVVAALIVRDDKFLLVAESRPSRKGLFNLPGGHIESHETILEAAVREAKEETGYDIEPVGFVGIYQTIYEDLNVAGPVVSARIIGGEVTSSDDHEEVIWVTADELYQMAKDGKLFTKYPPFVVNHYLSRGELTLDFVASYDHRHRP